MENKVDVLTASMSYRPNIRYHRSDANQDEMVDTLRKLGVRVHCWGQEGDLICQLGGVTVLCEVRQEGHPKKPRKGRQEKFQAQFMVKWLQTSDDCVELAKTLRRWHMAIMASGVPF